MRTTRLLLAFAMAAVAQAQPGWLMGFSGTLSNGVEVKFSTFADPPFKWSQPLKIGLGGIHTGSDRIHRFMVDRAGKSYFGYDLAAAPTDANHYRVTILPLTPTQDLAGYIPIALPRIPAPQTVQEGDKIALDLLVSADGSQKIVDYIQVSMKKRPPASVPAPSSAVRDYTLDDGPLKFAMDGQHDIFINGQPQPGLALTMKSGSTLWFYFPGWGRYVLSLEPRIGYGFQAAGTIQDNVIRFQADGNRYEIRFPAPLLSGGGTYRLYVLRDPEYRPANGAERMILGGIDRLENLVTR